MKRDHCPDDDDFDHGWLWLVGGFLIFVGGTAIVAAGCYMLWTSPI